MRWTKVVALAAAGSLSLAACSGGSEGGSSSSTTADPNAANNQDFTKVPASAGFEPDAKGPVTVQGAKSGGTLTWNVNAIPENTDPSTQYYQDVAGIHKLTTRTLTSYAMRGNKSVLVPDLATNLGEMSDDKLSWKFTLKKGIKYEDGTPIKASDIAYSVKRSFAQEEMPGGPTFQNEYFKDGDKYKGPWKSGENFAGVSADDAAGTITFNLSKPMQTLPYFAAFTMFSPVPKAKDTKTNYQLKWVATGPYKIESYSKGSKLTLVKNSNWDAKSDPSRTQYPDRIVFNFNRDNATTAKAIMADNGSDQTTASYDGVDASILQQVLGPKKNQVATGPSNCVTYVTMDTTTVPLEVRKAIATAWPYDQIRIAGGLTTFDYAQAKSYGAPQVPGFSFQETPGLTGTGKGDPAKAKQMLQQAGKSNFELSYYYASDDDTAKKIEAVRKPLLEAAGFKVKSIPVAQSELRKKRIETSHNVNLYQGTNGWCYDWPGGDSIYPPLFASSLPVNGGVGNIKNKALDKEMSDISQLPLEQQGPKWSAIDKRLRDTVLPALPYNYSKGSAIFGSKVNNVQIDPNQGFPDLALVWVG